MVMGKGVMHVGVMLVCRMCAKWRRVRNCFRAPPTQVLDRISSVRISWIEFLVSEFLGQHHLLQNWLQLFCFQIGSHVNRDGGWCYIAIRWCWCVQAMGKMPTQNSSDGAFYPLWQVFGPFSCWTGESKRWKLQLLLKGHKARREQQCNKKRWRNSPG